MRWLLGLVLLLAQLRNLPAQYAVDPVPEASGAAAKPAGANGTTVKRPVEPAAGEARKHDLYEETLRTFTPVLPSETGDKARAIQSDVALPGIYGLGDAAPAEPAQQPRKVPESLTENMPAGFLGKSDDVKIKGDLSLQYNLPRSKPGVVTTGESTLRTMAGLLGIVALAAWYAFQITKQDRGGGSRRHRQRRPY